MVSNPSGLNWFIRLLDPFLTIEPQVRKRLEQVELKALRSALLWQSFLWPVLYIAHYHVNDQKKEPLTLYFQYRYGMAVGILGLGAVGFFFRNNARFLKVILVFLSALLCIVQSWSMTLGPYISHAYLIWLPLIVLASFSRSYIFMAGWLVFLVGVTKNFWWERTELRFVFSDVTIGLFVLLGVHLIRRVWFESKAVQFLNDDLRNEMFLSQQTFDKHIKSFISPVLLKKIDLMRARGTSFIAALDSVLRLKRDLVVVLYSDIRNFSTRADDIEFVEKELIPSAKKIIDQSEDNGGVAKQIGDAVIVFYSFEDFEEAALRAIKDGVCFSLDESARVKSFNRNEPERFFTVTFGPAFVGNIASTKHREATVIGSPANLAARIDALTKEPSFREKMGHTPGVLLDPGAYEVIKSFTGDWEIIRISLSELKLSIRSYPNVQEVCFLPASKMNLLLLNQLLKINEMQEVFLGKELYG